MKLWNYRDKYEYPLCAESEDNYHVLRYNSIAVSNKLDKSIQALEVSLADNHTPSEIIKVISVYLYLWRNKTSVFPQCTTPSLTSAILAQNLIG